MAGVLPIIGGIVLWAILWLFCFEPLHWIAKYIKPFGKLLCLLQLHDWYWSDHQVTCNGITVTSPLMHNLTCLRPKCCHYQIVHKVWDDIDVVKRGKFPEQQEAELPKARAKWTRK